MLKELNKKRMKEMGILDTPLPDLKILEGHNPSSYYWIMPAKVLDYSDTADCRNVKEAREQEISIEELVVWLFLTKYILKAFDENLLANRCRNDIDIARYRYYGESLCQGSLDYNFFTFENIQTIINEVKWNIKYYNDKVQDFYFRFIKRMEEMIDWSNENGYDLIIIVGP